MLTALLSFWTHALASVLFAVAALWRLKAARSGPGKLPLVAALGTTALWALLAALDGAIPVHAPLAETVRNLAWLWFVRTLMSGADAAERNPSWSRERGARVVVATVGGILLLQALLDLVPLLTTASPAIAAAIARTGTLLRITAAAGALVLVHNVYGQADPQARGAIRLPMLGLAGLWLYDLNLYTLAYLLDRWPAEILAMRGAAAAACVPCFAWANRTAGDMRIRLSRAATFQSLSLGAICAYFLVMTMATSAGEATGWAWLRGAQVVLLIAMTAVAAVLIPSGRARAWLRVTLAKHFFQHRYDYRAEWLRFTSAMGDPGADAPPLEQRVVKAIADIVEAPAGLLLVADDAGRLEVAATWNWNGDTPSCSADPAFVAAIVRDARIVDFGSLRTGTASARDRDLPVPGALLDDPALWAGVPLIHEDRLAGLVLLTHPRFARALDWEDFDLLRTAGTSAASYLAEARGQEALSNAARFDEFNRRFAFILHDIKNVVSGLSLVARNAERHADNPAFRADMVATLKSSVDRMNDLLAKLAPQAEGRSEGLRAVDVVALLTPLIAAKRRRHDVRVLGHAGAVVADPARLEQALTHLIDNAIDASGTDAPVRIEIAERGGEVSIAVVDHGAGMSADFVRTTLFQPFASTKPGGFGIGAHQARSVVTSMGGTLAVDSRTGAGTRFTIRLPAAVQEMAA